MKTNTGLDAGFFIGRDDELVTAQSLALPVTLVEIQHPAGFLREIAVAGKNPTTMLPWSNRVGIKPAPYRCTADLRDNAAMDRLSYQIGATEARKR